MTVFVLSLVMALAGCVGLILAGRGLWQGWAIGLAVQPVWAVFAILTEGYGLLITCLMYGFVYGNNLKKWYLKKAEPKRPAGNWNHDWTKPIYEPRRKVVIAGDARQAELWCRARGLTRNDVVIASSFRPLEGLRFKREDLVYVGDFYNRHDIAEIQDVINRSLTFTKE